MSKCFKGFLDKAETFCLQTFLYASLLVSRCNKNYKMYFSNLSTNANSSPVVMYHLTEVFDRTILSKTIFPFPQNF